MGLQKTDLLPRIHRTEQPSAVATKVLTGVCGAAEEPEGLGVQQGAERGLLREELRAGQRTIWLKGRTCI